MGGVILSRQSVCRRLNAAHHHLNPLSHGAGANKRTCPARYALAFGLLMKIKIKPITITAAIPITPTWEPVDRLEITGVGVGEGVWVGEGIMVRCGVTILVGTF